MLFCDEPRFSKAVVAHPSNSQIQGFSKDQTAKHIGPSAYFSPDIEDKRNGWASRSFSKRQPMLNDSPVRTNRQDSYISGTLSKSGILSAPSPKNSPGPGQYERSIFPLQSPVRFSYCEYLFLGGEVVFALFYTVSSICCHCISLYDVPPTTTAQPYLFLH
jgi:hypothetical protein